MDKLAKNFIDNTSELNGKELIRYLRNSGKYHTSIITGSFISDLYKESLNIRSEVAMSAFLIGDHRLSYDLYTKNIEHTGLTEDEIVSFKNSRQLSVNNITNDYIYYNKDIVDRIVSRTRRSIPLITFTITSCKRFDLFEKTVNSFINCCIDLDRIDNWLCVDDNSSEYDRTKMKELYPFFTFYMKTPSEKGHPQSMNIIRDNVKTQFIFHMEDDWKFFHKSNYISQCMDVLNSNNVIGQCLINRNYAEVPNDNSIVGGILCKTKKSTRFYIHEYTHNPETTRKFFSKYGTELNCSYWPHFSFRPSLFKRNILTDIGAYNEKVSHFEMEYSYRYANKGYKSVFLDGIFCMHIGRLTKDRNDKNIKNAYDLNNESQFTCKEEVNKRESCRFSLNGVKTYLINLDSRKDRLKKFDDNSTIEYTRFSAIDGKKLKPNEQLQRIFEGNNFNMRVGLVGCAMSHIKLLIDLLKSDKEIFCILEDDATFGPNFEEQMKHLIKKLEKLEKGWDLVYLGNHIYPEFKHPIYNESKMPSLQIMNREVSLTRSMGGMYAYLITKDGIKKFLNFLNINGVINGIDTLQQKAMNEMKTFYSLPHIVFSECVLPGKNIDSDIQYNNDSLSMKNYIDNNKYHDRIKKNNVYNVDDSIQYIKKRLFQYTNDWFNKDMKLLKDYFLYKKCNILEIGTHEGQSTIWMLENLCCIGGSSLTSIDPYYNDYTTSETYKRFCRNIKLCTESSKFDQYIGYSQIIMPKLIEKNIIYDIVYINGSNIMGDIVADMDNAHILIRSNGIIVIEDAGLDLSINTGVMGAIKSFLLKHPSEYKLILKELKWMIQKI
jgi:GR25 family glycosyltransferase involved in LPS biosynthesis